MQAAATEGFVARDVYARHTGKEGGKAHCEQITEEQFNKERA